MKRQGSTELPRFAVGALAIAGASAANGAAVQITFTGSYISSSAGNTLVTDFGGDGDINLVWAMDSTSVNMQAGGFVAKARTYWGTNLSGESAKFGKAWVKGAGSVVNTTGGIAMQRGLVRYGFSDSNIRGGFPTTGYLDLQAEATGNGERKITVMRLIFDDMTGGEISGLNVTAAAFTEYGSSPVPEPGSNLALLALGAGGLTLRRRLKRAA